MTAAPLPLQPSASAITLTATLEAANVIGAGAMAEGQFVAYYRVSTARQGRSGLGLDAQREAVQQYLNGGNWQLIAEFTEVESGKRHENRPKLAEAMRLCRLRGAKLVIAKLDRLARNVHFISGLRESGVRFVAADIPDANDMTVNILATVAEHEAKMISARTKSALAAAKSKGRKLGGDRGNLPAVAHVGAAASAKKRSDTAKRRREDLAPIIDDIRAGGATSLAAIADELNVRGIPAARGGLWSAAQVLRVVSAA